MRDGVAVPATDQQPSERETPVRNRGPVVVLLVLLGLLGVARCFGGVEDRGNIVNPHPGDDRRGLEELEKRLSE